MPRSRPPFTRLSPQVYLYVGEETPVGAPEGCLMLQAKPDEAFGDGSHPTTRLCAGAVDLMCRLNPPVSALDVGTGTGVLARIMRARGVGFIAATDIDEVALRSARAHAELDPSSTPIHISSFAPDHWGERFELVVANILQEPLRTLSPALVSALAPGGTLLISGFTPLQMPILRTTFETRGLEFVSESILEEWSLLRFQKRR